MPQPPILQLKLSKQDKNDLTALIQQHMNSDAADLQRRKLAFKRWYQLWRNAELQPGESFPEQERSNFSIPLTQWQILARLAKELDVLLGEESEIVVTPIGETDIRRVPKVRKWINWRIKHSLKLFKKLYVYLLQKMVMGTTIGFVVWRTKKRLVKVFEPVEREVPATQEIDGELVEGTVKITEQVPREKEVIEFDGPDFVVENLEDWLIPTNARSLEEADHFARMVNLSIDDLLQMRDLNKLDFDKDILERLRDLSKGKKVSEDEASNKVSEEKKKQEQVPTFPQGGQSRIRVANWFGKFRRKDAAKVGDRSLPKLDPFDQDDYLVAFYQDDLKEVLGVARLVDMFPDGRIPFVSSQAIMDINSFWGRGLAEFLESINNEMDAIHKMAMDAGEGAMGPVVFYTPTSGFQPETMRMEPYTAIPTADPNGVKVVNLGQIQLNPYVLFMQELQGFAENVTGLTQPQLGKQFNQPNAPRTFGQQALLQVESNTRLLLDIRLERENLRELIHRIWEMDKRFLPEEVFFRVTEQDPTDVLTKEDMMGEFDFDIGPVTAISNKAQKTQELLQAFSIAAQTGLTPIVLPLLRKLIVKLGFPDVAALVPSIEEMRPPEKPEKENARLVAREDVDPHPFDNDIEHIAKHTDLLERIQSDELFRRALDPDVIGVVQAHIAEHQQAMKQKQLQLSGMGKAIASAGQGGTAQEQGQNIQSDVPNPLQGAFPNPQQGAQAEVASLLNRGGANIA